MIMAILSCWVRPMAMRHILLKATLTSLEEEGEEDVLLPFSYSIRFSQDLFNCCSSILYITQKTFTSI